VIGVELITGRLADISLVFRSSPGSTLAMVVTFAATLFIPLQWAIFLGAGLSFLAYLYTSATRGELVELRKGASGHWEEHQPPSSFTSGTVTVMQHKGNQFFAQAPALAQHIPDFRNTSRAVLILRVRDLETAPSTGLKMLEKFTRNMHEAGNRVMLAGVEPRIMKVLEHSGVLDTLGRDSVFPARPGRQEALDAAFAEAERWIATTGQR